VKVKAARSTDDIETEIVRIGGWGNRTRTNNKDDDFLTCCGTAPEAVDRKFMEFAERIDTRVREVFQAMSETDS
jgi:hypothetical protein